MRGCGKVLRCLFFIVCVCMCVRVREKALSCHHVCVSMCMAKILAALMFAGQRIQNSFRPLSFLRLCKESACNCQNACLCKHVENLYLLPSCFRVRVGDSHEVSSMFMRLHEQGKPVSCIHFFTFVCVCGKALCCLLVLRVRNRVCTKVRCCLQFTRFIYASTVPLIKFFIVVYF